MSPISRLFRGGLLLLAGVLASKISTRLGVPALLLFLGLGMLAGSEGVGGISFEDPVVAQGIGTVALAYILFSLVRTRGRNLSSLVGQDL